MDRYESKLKFDQIRSLLAENNISEAEKIVDSINWAKIKQVSALCLAGEVYEKAQRYQEARNCLLDAYERSPIGRTIIYRLTIVAIKSGDIESAEEYYNEFVDIAPTDSMRYILRYQIQRAKGVSVSELISILEEFKEQESSERWTYELAVLYHKAGMGAKCVDICDELILWFGEGKYVEKALELKLLYQPLNKDQEVKYRRMKTKKNRATEVVPDDVIKSGEVLNEPKVIPEVTTNPPTFNTVNLQQELASNMEKIMKATKKETVTEEMDNIKQLFSTIPYLQMPTDEAKEEEEEEDERFGHIETDEEIDGSLKIDFQEMLGEEANGQMTLKFEDQPLVEKQITGQMSIEEVLNEWEKTKQAAQKSLEMAEAKRLESAKARALKEAEGIMDRLNDIAPQLEAGKTPYQLMEEEYDRKMKAEEKYGLDVELELSATAKVVPQFEEPVKEVDGIAEAAALEAEENDEYDKILSDITTNLPDLKQVMKEVEKESEELRQKEMEEAKDKPEEPVKVAPIAKMTEAQKKLFTYFLSVDGMEQQICKAMNDIITNMDVTTSKVGNLIIEGGRGAGKTVLATDMIKALHAHDKNMGSKIGKITGASLNKKSPVDIMRKLGGGYLIIEKAGDLTRESIEGLNLCMESVTDGLIVVLEDTRAGIEKIMTLSPAFASKFSAKISIPIFTSDELVSFAKTYAIENGYVIDEMAILALYNRISHIQKVDRGTYVIEIKDILDNAMENADRGGLKKAFIKRKNDEGLTIIHEKDFER